MIRIFGISLFIGAFATLLVVTGLFYYRNRSGARAQEETVTVELSGLEEGSDTAQRDGVVSFSLFSESENVIFEGGAGGAATPVEAAYELLEKPIAIVDDNVQGVSTIAQERESAVQSLLPPRIARQLRQTRVRKDEKGNRTHVRFQQRIDNIPVFGSHVSIHIRNETDIYGMTGAIVEEESVLPATLSEERAVQIALDAAPDIATGAATVLTKSKQLYNPSLIGSSRDTKTHPALVVSVVDNPRLPAAGTILYISLADGTILLQEPFLTHALNRNILDCARSATCNAVRTEGSPPSGIADADSTYTHFGTIHSFLLDTLGRDSYDGVGSIMEAFVNLPDSINGLSFCPNAAWFKSFNYMYICPGLAVIDIIAHEFMHGVNTAEVAFVTLNQSGALDEALADMLAMSIDNDWTFAEDSIVGTARRIDNPGANNPPMPDRLFSPNYYCGTDDNGGVHLNMSIPTKAFYLMSEGGQSNGCTVGSIGKDKAMRIWYQALTRYLSFTSNFRDANNAVNQACADLYGAASAECAVTRNALQATEMDQQPLTTESITRCNGAVRQTPLCALPTNTPTPTITMTPPPSQCATIDTDCNGKTDLVDYESWRREYLGIATTMNSDFSGDGRVNLIDYEMWRRAYLDN